MDKEFEEELERRLQRMESPGGGGMVQKNLPWIDLVLCVVALVTVGTALLWWAY